MHLCLAAMPQVDDGFVDVEQDHGSSGPQAAAVADHLQQVALHGHFTTHTIETPLTWNHKCVNMKSCSLFLKDTGVSESVL